MPKHLTAYKAGVTCLLCDEGARHCPARIAIAGIFHRERYALDCGKWQAVQRLCAKLPVSASACVNWGADREVCPAGLDVVSRLIETHEPLKGVG